MTLKRSLFAGLLVALSSSSAFSQYPGYQPPGYLPYDAYRLNRDINRTRYDQFQTAVDRSQLNDDISSGNIGAVINDAQRLQSDRQRLYYDRRASQIDAMRVARDVNGGGGYYPGYSPGGPYSGAGGPGGGFRYIGGQFQRPW